MSARRTILMVLVFLVSWNFTQGSLYEPSVNLYQLRSSTLTSLTEVLKHNNTVMLLSRECNVATMTVELERLDKRIIRSIVRTGTVGTFEELIAEGDSLSVFVAESIDNGEIMLRLCE